jgi:hypothetical protein
MRGLAVALMFLTLSVAAAAQSVDTRGRIAFLQGQRLVVLDLATGKRTVAMTHAPPGPVRWSGDGRLVSDAGRIAGGPTLATSQLVWAPSGEAAAYQTRRGSGAVVLWSRGGSRTIVPAGWGATSFAWGPQRRARARAIGLPRPVRRATAPGGLDLARREAASRRRATSRDPTRARLGLDARRPGPLVKRSPGIRLSCS